MMVRATLAVLALALATLTPATAQTTRPPKPGDTPSQVAEGCRQIEGPVQFCDEAPDWLYVAQDMNPAINAQFDRLGGYSGLIIVEDLGRNDGLTAPAVLDSAVQILAEAGGVPVAQIVIHEDTQFTLGGQQHATRVYSGRIGPDTFTYVNTLVLMANWTIQIVTASNGMTYRADHSAVQSEFLAHVRVQGLTP